MPRLSKMFPHNTLNVRGHTVRYNEDPEGGGWNVELHHPSGLGVSQSFTYGGMSSTHSARRDAALAANRFIRGADQTLDEAYRNHHPGGLFQDRREL